MSMIYNLRQVPFETIELLLESPTRITHFLYPGIQAPAKSPGFFARLFGAKYIEPSRSFPQSHPLNETLISGQDVDLDKSWHGLHFLFTGTAWEGHPPAGFLLNWGEEIGEVDVGYGPARAFTAHQTGEIAEFLASISSETLRNRFNPKRMSELEIYPQIWDREETEGLDYLLEHFEILSQFVQDAQQRSSNLLVYLN